MGLFLLALAGALLLIALVTASVVSDARRPSRATMGWALARKLPVDPAALGWSFREWTGPQRTPIWEVSGGDPDGPLVVIVHGWRRSRIDSLRRAGTWQPHASVLLLLDLPGHGEALDGPTTLGITDGALVADVARDASSRSGARVVIVGHSMGAVAAIDAASRLQDESLAGVVLFAPYASLSEPIGNRLRSRSLPTQPFLTLANLWFTWRIGPECLTTDQLAMLRRAETPLLLMAARDDHTVTSRHILLLGSAAGVPVILTEHATHDSLGVTDSLAADEKATEAISQFLTTARCRAQAPIKIQA